METDLFKVLILMLRNNFLPFISGSITKVSKTTIYNNLWWFLSMLENFCKFQCIIKISDMSNKSTNFLTKEFDIFSLYNLALPITLVGFTIPRTNNTPKYLNIE